MSSNSSPPVTLEIDGEFNFKVKYMIFVNLPIFFTVTDLSLDFFKRFSIAIILFESLLNYLFQNNGYFYRFAPCSVCETSLSGSTSIYIASRL